MKLNQDKCHFLTNGSKECLWIRVGKEQIWESQSEKLLGITIDKNLTFNEHLTNICKKASQKLSALARISQVLPFHKRRTIMKAFVESQFSYCPLVWMFCSRKMDRKMNFIQERALRLAMMTITAHLLNYSVETNLYLSITETYMKLPLKCIKLRMT